MSSPTLTRVPGAGSVGLCRRLAEGAGSGTVVHAGAQAVYARIGGGVLGIVGRGAVHVPLAVAVDLPRLPPVTVGAPAELRDGLLRVAGIAVGVDRLTAVGAPSLGASAAARLDVSPMAVEPARRQLPSRALALLARGDAAAVPDLIGRGDGLTPVGDDALAGWLVGAYAAGRPATRVSAAVGAAAHRTTELSAALLAHAADGETIPELRGLLCALASRPAPPGAVEAATARLLAVGHTSGAGLLLGLQLALSPTRSPTREGAR